jgi:hyperosmotically inducible protein
MTLKTNNLLQNSIFAAALLALPALLPAEVKSVAQERAEFDQALAAKVRHELVMLPWLSIFDNLSFRVEDGVVTLSGQTIRPVLRSDAASVVKRLEGVRQVINNIEVLPLSPFDNDIRLRVARAIYGYPALQRYSLGALPSIRIVVKNGNVALEGSVASEFDRNLIFTRARGVAGVFDVQNNLQVESRKS